MNELLQLSTSKLQRILAVKRQIERLQAKLSKLAGATDLAAGNGRRKRRKMSAAGRKRIAAAAKARWAKWRAAKKK